MFARVSTRYSKSQLFINWNSCKPAIMFDWNTGIGYGKGCQRFIFLNKYIGTVSFVWAFRFGKEQFLFIFFQYRSPSPLSKLFILHDFCFLFINKKASVSLKNYRLLPPPLQHCLKLEICVGYTCCARYWYLYFLPGGLRIRLQIRTFFYDLDPVKNRPDPDPFLYLEKCLFQC